VLQGLSSIRFVVGRHGVLTAVPPLVPRKRRPPRSWLANP
jgi:hypothetical protein